MITIRPKDGALYTDTIRAIRSAIQEGRATVLAAHQHAHVYKLVSRNRKSTWHATVWADKTIEFEEIKCHSQER